MCYVIFVLIQRGKNVFKLTFVCELGLVLGIWVFCERKHAEKEKKERAGINGCRRKET